MGCPGSKVKGPQQEKKGLKKDTKAGGVQHGNFILESTSKVTDVYDIDKKKLGQGSYGSVCKCVNKVSGVARALKTIPKSAMKNIDRFRAEIQIMKIMDHPNIIKLHETFGDHRNIYLVMELCLGGELFDRIIDSGHFTEVQAAIVMQQIFGAVFYMHEHHVCHR